MKYDNNHIIYYLEGIFPKCTASQHLMAGKYRLVVPPANMPRPPPLGKVAAYEPTTTYIHTTSTYTYTS
jgi:hypothetical protein